ncbi:MAG: alpha/beta hydrolase-fold protein [Bacteroidota bacterium]
MKRTALLFLLISTISFAQDNVAYKKFNSSQLNTERIIKIYLPASYEENKENTYPVAVVFDAEVLFDVYVANSKMFAAVDEAPEQIIVGILQNQNKERNSDCDYSTDTGLPNEDSAKFYGFVVDELLPFIDDNYRTSLFKTIVGNTLTANFANYFFIDTYPPFNAYVNLNASYADNIAEKLEAKTQNLSDIVFYYTCSGNYNSKKRRTKINEVNNLLKLSEIHDFNYKFDNFENTSKTASIGQGIASSLGFIFEMFGAISIEEFDSEIAELSPPEAIAYLERKYVEIEYFFGSNKKIREQDVYRLESIIIDKDNGDYLEEFGKMINRLYPDSPLGDYYIGLYYETGYDYKKALKYYKNGYAKIGSDRENADAYYENIERVLDKRRAQKLGFPVGEDTEEEAPKDAAPEEDPEKDNQD